MEIWHSDCLDYNINQVYEYIKTNNTIAINLDVASAIKYCEVENQIDLSKVKMRSTLKKAKIQNPTIFLENDNILLKPFIINGNHSIIKAYQKGEKFTKAYKLNPDDIVECLSTDGYKEAYRIYKELQKYIPLRLNC